LCFVISLVFVLLCRPRGTWCACAPPAGPPGARHARGAEGTVTPAPANLARAGLRLDLDQPATGAVTVTLSRPERRNAMTPGTWRGLAAIGRSLPDGVRVVVVRGEGPSFSAGVDPGPPGGGGVAGEVAVARS